MKCHICNVGIKGVNLYEKNINFDIHLGKVHGSTNQVYANFRLKELGIVLNGLNFSDSKEFKRKELGKLEKVGLDLYVDEKNKRLYGRFCPTLGTEEEAYYKECQSYIW